jgi:hypothetical protein
MILLILLIFYASFYAIVMHHIIIVFVNIFSNSTHENTLKKLKTCFRHNKLFGTKLALDQSFNTSIDICCPSVYQSLIIIFYIIIFL